MALTDKLSFSDASNYQASFDAVAAGTANWAQAKEVEAVMEGLSYLRAIGNAAGVKIDERVNLLAATPADKQDAVVKLFDGDPPPQPRIVFDPDLRLIGTPSEVAAAKAAAQQQAPAS
jgi:hypothetical protein